MDFIQEDWEYEFQRDGIYILEARKQMELDWQEYQHSLNKHPTKIKILTPLKPRKNAVRNKLTSLRRNNKERIHS